MVKHLWKATYQSVCGEAVQSSKLRKNFKQVDCWKCINITKQGAVKSLNDKEN